MIDVELLERAPVELVDRLLFLKMLDLDWLLPICGLISVSRELLEKEAAAPLLTLGVLLPLLPSDGGTAYLYPKVVYFAARSRDYPPRHRQGVQRHPPMRREMVKELVC